MKRRWMWLVCGLVAFSTLSAVGWAAEAGPKFLPPASHLEGIKKAMGGLVLLASVLSLALGSVALMWMAAALTPQRVARAEAALRRGRWATVFLGVASAVALFGLGMFFGSLSQATGGLSAIVALLLLGLLLWLAAVGLAAMATIVGQRLLGDADGTQSPWRVVGAGGLAIAGSLLIPLFGWACFLYVLCRGVGAATLTLFAGRAPAEPEMETEESEAEGTIPAE